jgi:hypothetical protein
MIDPLLVIGIAALVAVGIVAAAVPKARTWALVALGAIAAFLGLRGLDRLLLGRRQEPLPPKPDKGQARLDAKEEAKAVEDAKEEATEAAPVRDTPPDLDALAARVNKRMDER